MKKAIDTFNKVATDFNAFLLFAIVVIICIQVVTRRMSISASWCEEICRYLFVIVGFMTWPVVILRGTDIVISSFFDNLPKKARIVILGIYSILAAAIVAIVFYSILRNISNAGDVYFVSIRAIKLVYVYYFVAAGLVLSFIANIIRAIMIWTKQVEVLTDKEKSMKIIAEESEKAMEEYDEMKELNAEREGGNA